MNQEQKQEALNDEALEDVSGGVILHPLSEDGQGSTGEQPSASKH